MERRGKCPQRIYRAAAYLRLSREDGEREESNSIAGQRQLIRSHVERFSDIALSAEYVDDGYSGTTFDRPGFQALLEAVRVRKVDCIVVKDLSRFGRNYIEAGRYLEQVFPFLGVRFIALGDGYDSLEADAGSDGVILPFRNLLNEAYSRDISVKIRSHLAVKRRQGEFVGAFAPYGYRRSGEDRHRLEPEADAAAVVRGIFRWKLEGMSCQGISDKLRQGGVLCPAAHKQSRGDKYRTALGGGEPDWSAVAVGRILSDPVYTGLLVQGRTCRPSLRLQQRKAAPREEWTWREGAHPAIIPDWVFQRVRALLQVDTRIAPGEDAVYPLAGLLRCGGCGEALARKAVTSRGKRYTYYICGGFKAKSGCTSHSIRADRLEEAVWSVLQKHVASLPDLEGIWSSALEVLVRWEDQTTGMDQMCRELERYRELLGGIDGDRRRGILDEEEFDVLKRAYADREKRLARYLAAVERRGRDSEKACPPSWLMALCREDSTVLRFPVAALVAGAYVDKDKRVRLLMVFRQPQKRKGGEDGENQQKGAAG